MQFASYGYFCVVPDFMDGSAPWTTDDLGDDVFFKKPSTDLKLKKGHNPKLFEFFKDCNSQR